MYVPVLSMRGLGLYEPTAQGFRYVATATCLTPAEQQEAQSKCVATNLRGLGQTTYRASGPMVGRLTGMDPCMAKNLPPCPTPKCLDETTVAMIASCASGAPYQGVDCANFDAWTKLSLAALSNLPFCRRPSWLTLPSCLSQSQLATEFYCQRYPQFNGPDKAKNAQCWMMMHDPSYWSAYQGKVLCPSPSAPAPAPGPRPVVVARPLPAPLPSPKPGVIARPTAVAPPPPGVTPPPPMDIPPPPAPPAQHGGIGVGGLLAIAAGVAVGGWLLFGKKKKKLPVPAAA